MNKRDQTFPLHRQMRREVVERLPPTVDGRSWGEVVSGVPKFLMTNIADMLRQEDDMWTRKHVSELEGLVVRPPFDEMWVEYSYRIAPATMWRTGMFLQYKKACDLSPQLYRIDEGTCEAGIEVLVVNSQTDDDVAFGVGSLLFPLVDDRLVFTETGGGQGYLCTTFVPDGWQESVKGAASALGVDMEWGSLEQGYAYELHMEAAVALFGFALLHCKNGRQAEVEYRPSPAVRRAFKINMDELDKGRVTYRVVKVGTVAESNGAGDDAHTATMPLHICRGHFRTYSTERPMFGKYSGTFWVPAHTRGNKAVGVALKDYEEVATQNEG